MPKKATHNFNGSAGPYSLRLGLSATSYRTSVVVLQREHAWAMALVTILRRKVALLRTEGRDATRSARMLDEVQELVIQLDRIIPGMEAAQRAMEVLETLRRTPEPPPRIDSNSATTQSRAKKRTKKPARHEPPPPTHRRSVRPRRSRALA